jgi:hypothetical protein
MEGKPIAPGMSDPRGDALHDLPGVLGKLRDVKPDDCPADRVIPGDLIESPVAV